MKRKITIFLSILVGIALFTAFVYLRFNYFFVPKEKFSPLPSLPKKERKIAPQKPLIESAREKERRHKFLQEKERYFGISCHVVPNDECERFLIRIAVSKDLQTVLKFAKSGKVLIILEKEFDSGKGWVSIDINSSNETIIKNLIGNTRFKRF